MRKIDLTTGRLSLKNLKAKPVRTACLVVVVAVLAFALFGGAVITLNLRQGLAAMTKRFGADLMVVPKGAAEKAKAALLFGETGYFYFDGAIADTIARTEGITRASPQFYLTSLSTECCDSAVQLIAYDPATDFVVQPWIAERYAGRIGDGQVVVGSRIFLDADGAIKLFNHQYPVAARLSKSASGLDTSIFMTMNTMRQLIDRGHAEQYAFLADSYGDKAISVVLATVDPAKNPSGIAYTIRKENEGVEALVSSSVFAGISKTLSGLTDYVYLFAIVIWLLAVVVLAAVFSGTIHERKKEFAVLRILGATRKKVAVMVLCESSLAGIAGGAAGIVLAGLVIFPFSALISERLALPWLDASFFNILPLVLFCLLLSALTGPLASLYAALKISGAETYITMREGE